MVDEILGRPIPAVVIKHRTADMDDSDALEVTGRARDILDSLREDAKDLWEEV